MDDLALERLSIAKLELYAHLLRRPSSDFTLPEHGVFSWLSEDPVIQNALNEFEAQQGIEKENV